QHHQPRGVDLGAALGDPVVDRLLVGQEGAGRDAAAHGVAAHHIQGALADNDPAHTVVDAPRPQPLLGDAKAFTLRPQQVGLRHAAPLEADLPVTGVVAAPFAHDRDVAHQPVTRGAGGHNDLAGAVMAVGVGVGDRHDDGKACAVRAGGEPLVPVDHVVVPVLDRARVHQYRVGPGVFRLGHGVATADVAAR